MRLTAALLVLPVLALLGLAVATAQGARRRGVGRPAACALGLVFPVTWVAWYALDELTAPSGGGRFRRRR
jgi:hypothetical protein